MKISIITVVKNDEKFIDKTINSIINQNLPIEYIVVDGNSNDSTLEIIKKYQNKIDLIISEEDKNLYDAMNKGITKATGDIIGICNSGDIILEDKLKIVLEKGKISNHDRHRLSNWSKKITSVSGANYLTKIINFIDGSGKRPQTPWNEC